MRHRAHRMASVRSLGADLDLTAFAKSVAQGTTQARNALTQEAETGTQKSIIDTLSEIANAGINVYSTLQLAKQKAKTQKEIDKLEKAYAKWQLNASKQGYYMQPAVEPGVTAPPATDNTMTYVLIGGGALVAIVLLTQLIK